jgi:hypothetical protein
MSSSSTLFSESVANLTKTVILEPLVTWLKGKGVEVTVEEMVEVLKLPVNVTPRLVSNYTQPLPSVLAGTTAKPRAASRKIAGDPDRPCQYLFKKGKKEGSICGEPSVPGTDYCSVCSKKRTVMNKLGTSKSVATKPVQIQAPQATPEIPLEPYGDPNDKKYLDREHGFIVKVPEDGVAVATSILDGEQERPLTEEEENLAKSKGISLPVKTTPVATIPTTTNPRIASFSKPPVFQRPKMPVLK